MLYTVLKDIEEGEILIADGGFTCLKDKEEVRVEKDNLGDLFILCKQGKHFLDGQWNEDEKAYVGFWKKDVEKC